MRWADQQAMFATALLDSERPLPGFVTAPSGGAATRRFAVYRNNVTASLIEAVSDNYPVVARLVGDAFMRAMAAEYVRLEPPASPVLLAYGRGFADFMESFPPAARLPYLADMARLEWAWLEAYHAADAEPIGIDVLAGLDEARLVDMRLALLPSLRLVSSNYPVGSMWQAHQQEMGDMATTLRGLAMVPETVLVSRSALDVDVKLVAPGDAAFIARLEAGDTLGDAIAVALRHQDFDPAAAIAHLFASKLVVGLADAPDAQPPSEDKPCSV